MVFSRIQPLPWQLWGDQGHHCKRQKLSGSDSLQKYRGWKRADREGDLCSRVELHVRLNFFISIQILMHLEVLIAHPHSMILEMQNLGGWTKWNHSASPGFGEAATDRTVGNRMLGPDGYWAREAGGWKSQLLCEWDQPASLLLAHAEPWARYQLSGDNGKIGQGGISEDVYTSLPKVPRSCS